MTLLKIKTAVAMLLLAAAPVAVHAQTPPPAAAQVNVTVGPVLAAKSERYGADQVALLSKDLANAARRAAARGGFSRLDLVLEDAEPNRPTAAMLGRWPELDPRSVSLGGARITGTAYRGGGAEPLKSSWYESDLRDELPGDIWSDAERAFGFLAADLSRGRVPTRFGPGAPAGDAVSDDVRDPWTRTR